MLDIVYYSKGGNIKNFLTEKLSWDKDKVHEVTEEQVTFPVPADPFVLVVPSYEPEWLEVVYEFMEEQGDKCIGVACSGNRAFASLYLYSGIEIAEEYGVPLIYGFELRGMPADAYDFEAILENVELGLPVFTGQPYIEKELSHAQDSYKNHKLRSGFTWNNPLNKNKQNN